MIVFATASIALAHERPASAFARDDVRRATVAPLTGRMTLGELAQDILAHAPPRFTLAGLSMGGIAAMVIARQSATRRLNACLPEVCDQ